MSLICSVLNRAVLVGICLIFLSLESRAQQSVAYQDSFERFYWSADSILDRLTIDISTDSLDQWKSDLGKTSPQRADLHYLYGRIYNRLGLFASADRQLELSRRIGQKHYSTHHPKTIRVRLERYGTHFHNEYRANFSPINRDSLYDAILNELSVLSLDDKFLYRRTLLYKMRHAFKHYHIESAHQAYAEILNQKDLSEGDILSVKASFMLRQIRYLYQMKKRTEMNELLDELIHLLERNEWTENHLYARAVTTRGIDHLRQSRFDDCFHFFNLGYQIRTELSEIPAYDLHLMHSLHNLHSYYTFTHQYEKAIETIQEYFRLYKNLLIVQDLPVNFNSQNLLLNNISQLYLSWGNLHLADSFSIQALQSLKNVCASPVANTNLCHSRKLKYTLPLARSLARQGRQRQAVHLLSPELHNIIQQDLSDNKFLPHVHYYLGKWYFELGEIDSSHLHYRLSLDYNGWTSDSGTAFDQVEVFPMLIKALGGLSMISIEHDEDYDLTAKLYMINLVLESLHVAIFKVNNEHDLNIIMEDMAPWFEAVFVFLEVVNKTNTCPPCLKKLVEITDLIKGISNYELNRQQLQKDLADSVEQQLLVLKSDIIQLEKQLYEIENPTDPFAQRKSKISIDSIKYSISLLNKSEFLLREKSMECSSPVSYNYTNIDDIQAGLSPKTMFLQYTEIGDTLHLITLQQKDMNLFNIGHKDTIRSLAEKFFETIFAYPLSCQKTSKAGRLNRAKLKILTDSISELLLPPSIKFDRLNSLVISPSNSITQIPFEVLLDPSSPKESGQLLINRFDISYMPFFGVYHTYKQDSYENSIAKFDLLAPDFTSSDTTICTPIAYRSCYLGKLTYNLDEIENIASIVPSNLFSHRVTKERLHKILSHSNWIHLATHGKVNEQHDEYSFLAIHSSETDQNKIDRFYLTELKNTPVSAECVVLSACETGLGKYYAGSGIKSLASAFMMSGSQSVISSLWAVNDQSTSQIMTRFYHHLRAGKSKDRALKQAKLDFLSSCDPEFRHPFYWAGFIATGDMQPVFRPEVDRQKLLYYILIIVGLVAAFCFFRWRRQRVGV